MKMIRIIGYYFFTFILVSCDERNNDESNSYFSNELSSKILEYQRSYPIPKEHYNDYVYVGKFLQLNTDTLFLLWRSKEGFDKNDKNIYGVYFHENLKPTIILDSSNSLSKGFIKTHIQDSLSLSRFHSKSILHPSEITPPLYQYKISGWELQLISKDTGWKHWE